MCYMYTMRKTSTVSSQSYVESKTNKVKLTYRELGGCQKQRLGVGEVCEPFLLFSLNQLNFLKKSTANKRERLLIR